MIESYCDLLKKWNKSVNLVQKDTVQDVFERHIKDSEQISVLLSKRQKIVDIGSGAGLPGVVLAINGFENVTLCENNKKKVAFLRMVRQELGVEYSIFDRDVYEFEAGERYVAVSRAFGSLSKLCDVMVFVKINTGFFHKGENYLRELEEAKLYYDFRYETFPSLTHKNSVIVKTYDVRRKLWEK